MTASLSARIYGLEQRAEAGRQARETETGLLAQISELQHELEQARKTAQDGEYAERILTYLGEQTDRVLTGGAAMRGEDAPAEAEEVQPAVSTGVDMEVAEDVPALVTAEDAEMLFHTLKDVGYAVPSSALLRRLKVRGMTAKRVEAAAGQLLDQQRVIRQPDGKYALPQWSKR